MTSKDSNQDDSKISGTENFQWILDQLPFGISLQTIEREILFENETVKIFISVT